MTITLKYSLDLYSDNQSYSFPFQVVSYNNLTKEEIDKCLYKLYFTVMQQLYIDYNVNCNNNQVVNMNDWFDIFDIYLSKINDDDSVEPIFSNSDNIIKDIANFFDAHFVTIESNDINLNELIKSMVGVNSFGNNGTKNCTLRYRKILCPPWLSSISYDSDLIRILANQNYQKMSTEILFIVNNKYRILINSINWGKLINFIRLNIIDYKGTQIQKRMQPVKALMTNSIYGARATGKSTFGQGGLHKSPDELNTLIEELRKQVITTAQLPEIYIDTDRCAQIPIHNNVSDEELMLEAWKKYHGVFIPTDNQTAKVVAVNPDNKYIVDNWDSFVKACSYNINSGDDKDDR